MCLCVVRVLVRARKLGGCICALTCRPSHSIPTLLVLLAQPNKVRHWRYYYAGCTEQRRTPTGEICERRPDPDWTQKSAEGGIDYYHLDYLFDVADFQTAKQYFVYDPDVAATGTPTGKWVQAGKTLSKVEAGTTPGSAAAKAADAKKADEKKAAKLATGSTTVPSLAVAVVAMFALWR